MFLLSAQKSDAWDLVHDLAFHLGPADVLFEDVEQEVCVVDPLDFLPDASPKEEFGELEVAQPVHVQVPDDSPLPAPALLLRGFLGGLRLIGFHANYNCPTQDL